VSTLSLKGTDTRHPSTDRGVVLVVDDNFENRDMLSRRLQRNGYSATTAASGTEALELIEQRAFDLILLDVMMPGIDGFAVLEHVRKRWSMADLPIILLTAKDQSEDVVRGFQLGANDYITKPIDFPIVLARLQTQLALKKTTASLRAAHDKMKRELEAAARIQRALIPQTLPNSSKANFTWIFYPCAELAGDILDVFQLDETHIGCYVLDVSGHGVEAALLAVTLSRVLSQMAADSLLLERSPSGETLVIGPAEVARTLNRRFPMEEEMPQYFTLLYGILDLREQVFRYVSAGHPGPLHVSAAGPRLLPSGGLPIGMFPNSEYEETAVPLAPGDRVYLYSDGVTETLRDDKDMFAEQFITSLCADRRCTLEESVENLLSDLKAWCASKPNDDISVLAFQLGT
jgi:sigma-B regulation protein RsbU (phosphoserine phosphatase)